MANAIPRDNAVWVSSRRAGAETEFFLVYSQDAFHCVYCSLLRSLVDRFLIFYCDYLVCRCSVREGDVVQQ